MIKLLVNGQAKAKHNRSQYIDHTHYKEDTYTHTLSKYPCETSLTVYFIKVILSTGHSLVMVIEDLLQMHLSNLEAKYPT